jgi:hypothetical protein
MARSSLLTGEHAKACLSNKAGRATEAAMRADSPRQDALRAYHSSKNQARRRSKPPSFTSTPRPDAVLSTDARDSISAITDAVHAGLAGLRALEEGSARFFSCSLCRKLAIVCRRCDRGHRYCSPACAGAARRRSLSEANKRYAATRRGRMTRARCSSRCRASKNKVIDQSSLMPPADGLLRLSLAVADEPPVARADPAPSAPVGRLQRCCCCGRSASPFLRRDFIRRRAPRTTVQNGKRGAASDNPP